jgi:uncharacterized membrane protein
LTFYDVVLWVHVTAVVASFGLTLVYPLLMTSARQGGERALPALHWLVGMWGARLVSAGGFAVLAAGLYLAVDGPYEFGDPWIGTSLLILIVLGGLAGGYFSPRERRLSELASRDLEGGGLSGEYEALAGRVRVLSYVAALLVLVALFLMVVKPGA